MTQIEHAGQAYTVPYFTDGSATAGLAVCTSCHGDNRAKVNCDNLKWRDHLTLNRVPLAIYQLAEATYIGSLCPGSTPTPTNLALNKTASASSTYSSTYASGKAVDGDTATRWWTRNTGTQWLKVDLGQTRSVNRVVINWHTNYATTYEVQVSTDNSNWTRVKIDTAGNGGVDDISFTSRSARYVRIYSTRARSDGYSVNELEVYAP